MAKGRLQNEGMKKIAGGVTGSSHDSVDGRRMR